mmetsp:Transcript_834/g.1182  ORF Transcript_834/g.1182 Transcript_834/m.1182 type:complete len:589 (-) Transcript_834:160-1926(-)
MLRHREDIHQQHMSTESTATSALPPTMQSQGSPVWLSREPSTTNSTNVTGSSHTEPHPSATIKNNINCLPHETSSSCTDMECSPVVEPGAASISASTAGFGTTTFSHEQAHAPTVTPGASSVSLQQFEDAPEDDEGQYSHLPRLNVQTGAPESRSHSSPTQSHLQPRSHQDDSAQNVMKMPQRPSNLKPQRQSSLDALAMVCEVENRVMPVPANAAVAHTASSSFSAPMLLGANDQEGSSCTLQPTSAQAMPTIPLTSDVTTKPVDKIQRDDAVVVSGSSAPSSPNGGFQFSLSDVLCGRGGLTNHHPGNVLFRKLVRSKQEEYLRATKRDKAGVAREIVDTIRHLDPPGRFLKKDPSNPGQWVEIGNRKAREKTSQALREGAPELRNELSEAAAANMQQSPQQQNNMFLAPPMRTVTCDGMAMLDPATNIQALRGRKVSEEGVAVAAALAEADQAQFDQHQPQIMPHRVALTTPPSDAGPHHIYDVMVLSKNHSTPSQSVVGAVPMDTSMSHSSGSKRKLDNEDQYAEARQSPMPELCAIQERRSHDVHDQVHDQGEQCSSPGGTRGKGGPRIKMLKDRMRDFACVQ